MLLLVILLNILVSSWSDYVAETKRTVNDVELDAQYWESLAKTELFEAYQRQNHHAKAKNVIVFVGGGMGLSTITPARILKGQLNNGTGEEAKLVFEGFPNACLIKTYTIDSQVADSAATATAILSGVKTNNGVTGVTARVKYGESNCETVQNNLITSIFDMGFEATKSTGIITNTRITEATAAGAYASSASRDWEGSVPPKFAHHPTHEDCKDIARQLVENHPGRNLNVILGGGGRYLYPKNYTDPITGRVGQREDGLNLVDKWLELKKSYGLTEEKYKFVNNRDQLLKSNSQKDLEYIFGIFDENHMNYDKERDVKREPTLEEMVETAINILKKNSNGYVLVIESGLIDLAHHENYANLALYETLALEKAVQKAMSLSSIEDTLLVVTADHSQALTMNGYPSRGQNILGIAGKDDETHKAYTTLLYSNGPGYKKNRTDPESVDTTALRYQTYSAVYLESSHHTGEDVALYAIGPMSYLFHGTKEQTFISHAIQFATCIGNYLHHDHCVDKAKPTKEVKSDGSVVTSVALRIKPLYMLLILILIIIFIKFI